MKRPETEYLNEYNPNHFTVPRRADPPWYKDEGIDGDAVVVGFVITVAAITFICLAITEAL